MPSVTALQQNKSAQVGANLLLAISQIPSVNITTALLTSVAAQSDSAGARRLPRMRERSEPAPPLFASDSEPATGERQRARHFLGER